MRIKLLDLKAFGPFTNHTISFQSPDPGLHIIFGPNEAGKSSSLRALKALLYGFPERTTDNFRHAFDQLMVGGCLATEDGREITFFRRKKRKADLLDPDGNPMDGIMLAPFLHGIDAAVFESLYGIDHEMLVRGGEEILAQRGEVGQAIFAAGAGISSLRAIFAALENEADALFRARGSKQEIHLALAVFKELQREVKAASLPSREWKEHHTRLNEAVSERMRLEEERSRKTIDQARLERLKRAIPELALHRNLLGQLQDLGDVVQLPADFDARWAKVEQAIREARLTIEKDTVRFETLRDRSKGILINTAILDHATMIEDLQERLGAYRKSLEDRVGLDDRRIHNRTEAATLLEHIQPGLPLDEAESLRPILRKKRVIQELVSRHEALTQQAAAVKIQQARAEKELAECVGLLADLPPERDGQGLLQALNLARRAGNLDEDVEKRSLELKAEKTLNAKEWKRLGLHGGECERLPELPLPLADTVKRFEDEHAAIAEESRLQKKERKEVEHELELVKTELLKMEYTGGVPTEQDLGMIRAKRDEGWRLIRRVWLDAEDVAEASLHYAGALSLPDAYENEVLQADHTADRLRREADRVARVAELRARAESLTARLQTIDHDEKELAQRQDRFAAAWRTLWEPLAFAPLSPKEMAGWLAAMEKLRFKVTETAKKEDELHGRRKKREELRAGLIMEIQRVGDAESPTKGDTLTPVLLRGEAVLDAVSKNKADRERLLGLRRDALKRLERARDDHETARQALASWQGEWREAVTGLDVGGAITPTLALDLLETLQACFAKVKDADELQKRISGIDRDAAQYAQELKTTVEKTAPALIKLPVDQAARELQSILARVRQDSALHDKLHEEIKALTFEIEATSTILGKLAGERHELLRMAGCEEAISLPEIIRKNAEYSRLKEKISDTEAFLAKIAEGMSIETMEAEARGTNVASVAQEIAVIAGIIDQELNPRINTLSQIIGEETKELERMDGGTRATDAAEAMERELAKIRRLAEHYVRLKLAARILHEEIERYRALHQDPVLRLASRYFQELTLASFSGLRTDVADNNEPVLVGIRLDGARLSVSAMSSGTRDQLYLALRLATLEWRHAASEPMPFIVDDILINFDDARSQATLKALADLAATTQVILFTHHRRIVDEARGIKGAGSIHVHELYGTPNE